MSLQKGKSCFVLKNKKILRGRFHDPSIVTATVIQNYNKIRFGSFWMGPFSQMITNLEHM